METSLLASFYVSRGFWRRKGTNGQSLIPAELQATDGFWEKTVISFTQWLVHQVPVDPSQTVATLVALLKAVYFTTNKQATNLQDSINIEKDCREQGKWQRCEGEEHKQNIYICEAVSILNYQQI